jgi:hypothetical protein
MNGPLQVKSSVCLSIYLSIYLSTCLSVCLSVLPVTSRCALTSGLIHVNEMPQTRFEPPFLCSLTRSIIDMPTELLTVHFNAGKII